MFRFAWITGWFVGLISSVFPSQVLAQKQALTARQIVDQIHQHLGVAAPSPTVDTFKAGNPDTVVTGIAVTMMATFDVLQRAAAEGDNFVITHEPTFYNHLDSTAALEKQEDAVLATKQKFISEHGLVVWRFHDGWHAHHPDGILLGMTRALNWSSYQIAGQQNLFVRPALTVNALALEVKQKLGIRMLRVVGEPSLAVTRIAFLPGAAGSARQIQLLERPDVEALLIGEAPEWETIEYVADAVSQGKHKALLILGHIPSEQAGMEECAAWLRSFINQIPVHMVKAEEPFWAPSRTQTSVPASTVP